MNPLHKFLMKVRPAELAVVLKVVLGVRRLINECDVGFRLWLDPVSHFGAEVLETGTYEPELLGVIQRLLRPGDCFVDVGANEGFFSLAASYAVEQGKVLAIEPQSRLIPVIKKNIALNQLTNITLIHGALAENAGTSILHLAADTNTGASSQLDEYAHLRFRRERVNTFSLDSLLKENGIGKVRFLKIDVEGAEARVLAGALELIRQNRVDYIAVEFHPQITGESVPNAIDKLMREHKYLLTEISNQQWLYHRPELAKELLPFSPMLCILPLAA